MAKQRGIHQIKGKINNLCYYEQKYVRGGLIRRINEAMSERLKTDPAFASTRFYNTIFGACSNYAKCVLSMFGSRSRFLFLPYRQSILTRYLFDLRLKNYQSSGFPDIGFYRGNVSNWVFLIDNLMKNKLSANFPSVSRFFGFLDLGSDLVVTIPSSELEDYCIKYNVKSVQVSHTRPLFIYNASYSETEEKYISPDFNYPSRLVEYFWSVGDGDLELRFNTGDTDDAFTFWILYISPVAYTIGGRGVTQSTGATCGIIQFTAT